MHRKSDLLVWDLDNQSDSSIHDVIYWSSYTSSKSDGIFSIPQLIEESADYLKAKYLKLIYEFGEAKVNGKRIIDHLIIRQNFSFWWMTLFAEKCNYSKSPQIDNIIKLMALEQWLQENKYQKLKLVTVNDELAMSVSLLAKRLLIDFEWKKEQRSKPDTSVAKKAFHALPNIIQSPIWLMYYLLSNWPLKGVGVKEWRKTTATTTFVSYLFNLVPETTKQGRYESRYWTTLTDLLDDNQYSTNWLHIYIEDSLLPSAKKARDLIQRFNHIQNGNQVHVTLASFLTVPLIFRTLQDWYKVLKLNKLVAKQLQVNSGYLWPLFKKDCQDSMSGIPAMSNLLYFNLFEKAMSELPIQKRGCYLQENQGWEFGFISAWQSAGHKKNLIGFPPSAVIYWDLRNFFDPRSYKRKGQCDLPLPDYVGVNGEVSKNTYLRGGYLKEDLIEVESLRYLYLSNFSIHQAKRESDISKGKMVLVVGDYLKENTNKQLNLLSSTIVDVDQSIRFIIKPHPACPINMVDFPGLRGELSTRPIEELMKISDVVYSSLITSAALDAYCAGLPIITMLDGKTLNVSPLRDSKGVYFVSDSKGLVNAINTAKATDSDQRKHYFYLDSGMPRWHKWLIDDFDKDEQKEFKS
jgi:surface carbohydrate biosynthesis protein (TIGR04326 family)